MMWGNEVPPTTRMPAPHSRSADTSSGTRERCCSALSLVAMSKGEPENTITPPISSESPRRAQRGKGERPTGVYPPEGRGTRGGGIFGRRGGPAEGGAPAGGRGEGGGPGGAAPPPAGPPAHPRTTAK